MADTVSNPSTPTVEPTTPDTKASETLLGAESKPPVTSETVKVDPAVDPAKDTSKSPEQVKAEADKAAADAKAKEGAVEYKFKSPEGVTLDEKVVGEFTGIAKDLKLSNEDAQKIVDLGPKLVSNIQQAQAQALEKAGEDWRKELESDKEFGGSNFKQSQELAIRLRDKFATPEERDSLKLLFNSAWGNYPALFKMLARAGKALGEDKIVDGTGTQSELTAAQVMYGKK
jgi:hypothetical protein